MFIYTRITWGGRNFRVRSGQRRQGFTHGYIYDESCGCCGSNRHKRAYDVCIVYTHVHAKLLRCSTWTTCYGSERGGRRAYIPAANGLPVNGTDLHDMHMYVYTMASCLTSDFWLVGYVDDEVRINSIYSWIRSIIIDSMILFNLHYTQNGRFFKYFSFWCLEWWKIQCGQVEELKVELLKLTAL